MESEEGADTQLRVEGSTLGPGNLLDPFSSSNGSAAHGGGAIVVNFGRNGSSSLDLVNSTVSGNTVRTDSSNVSLSGGGLSKRGFGGTLHLRVASSTISGNQVQSAIGEGGGIAAIGDGSGSFVLDNSILFGNIAGNAANANCAHDDGLLQLRGRNVLGGHDGVFPNLDVGTCPVDLDTGASLIPLTNPQLSPLADNGGPTATHAFDASSVANDGSAGERCFDLDGSELLIDQRGLPRVDCDIGAFERP